VLEMLFQRDQLKQLAAARNKELQDTVRRLAFVRRGMFRCWKLLCCLKW